MSDDVSTVHDTTERLNEREPEVLSEEQITFADGEVTTRSGVESEDADPDNDAEEEVADKGENETATEDSVESLRAQLEHERNAKRAARRAERRLKQENADLRQGKDAGQEPEPTKPASADAPKLDDYEDPNEWLKASLEFHGSAPKQAETQPTQSPEIAAAIADVKDADDDGMNKYADYKDVVYNDDLKLSVDMIMAIADTDAPEDVAYYLGKNPEEAARIHGLDGRSVLREITKIETRIAANGITVAEPVVAKPALVKKVVATNAPAPMKTIDGSGSPTKSPDSMDQAAYEQWRKSQRRV